MHKSYTTLIKARNPSNENKHIGHLPRIYVSNYVNRIFPNCSTVPENCASYKMDEDPVKKGCILPRLSHYPLMSGPLEQKFEIFRTCPAVAKRQSLFKMQPAYKVGRKNTLKHPRRTEFDIMYEIMTHGPVQGK